MRRLLALLICVPGLAAAEVRPSDINRPVGQDGLGPGYGDYTTQWSLDMVGHFATLNADTLSESNLLHLGPLLRLATPFGRNEVDVVIGAFNHRVTVKDTDQTQSMWRLTNLHLAHHWTWRTLAEQTRLGLGLTLPTARLPADANDELFAVAAYAMRSQMHGLREAWLYQPGAFSITSHGDYYWRAPSGLIVGGAGTVGVMLDTLDSLYVPDRLLVLQGEAELAYDTSSVRSSLTVGAAWFPNAEEGLLADDPLQISVEPEFRFRLGSIDLIVGMSIPIDEPAGFAFSEDGVWAVRVGVANGTSLLLPEEEDVAEDIDEPANPGDP